MESADLKKTLTEALVHIVTTTEYIEAHYPMVARSLTWQLHKKIEKEVVEALKVAIERA